MQVHPIQSHVGLTGKEFIGLSSPRTITIINNKLKVTNVHVVELGESSKTSYACLTNTILRSLKLTSAPLMLPPQYITTSFSTPISCILLNEETKETMELKNATFRLQRHITMELNIAKKKNLKQKQLVAFKISSPRNTTTYCDIVVLPQQRNDDDGDTTIHVYMDTDEVNSSMYKDALSYDLYIQSDVQHNNLLMNFTPIMHVDTIIDDGRKNVWDIEQQPRPNKQLYPIANETDIVENIHFQNPSSDINVKDAELTIDTSNRHLHLSPEDLSILFPGKKLRLKKAVAYIPEFIAKYTGFAAKETVTIRNVETGDEIRHLRVLGPVRKRTQIELAYTDCLNLGVEAPARISGDNVNSGAKCILIAEDDDGNLTNNQVELKSGIVRAWRHLHIYEDPIAERLGVVSGDLLTVGIKSPKNTTIFHDVLVRVGNDPDGVPGSGFVGSIISYLKPTLLAYGYPALRFVRGTGDAMYIHLDTDEANAACIGNATNYTLYQQIGKEKLRLIGTTRLETKESKM